MSNEGEGYDKTCVKKERRGNKKKAMWEEGEEEKEGRSRK